MTKHNLKKSTATIKKKNNEPLYSVSSSLQLLFQLVDMLHHHPFCRSWIDTGSYFATIFHILVHWAASICHKDILI
jgi:hypothetical protein